MNNATFIQLSGLVVGEGAVFVEGISIQNTLFQVTKLLAEVTLFNLSNDHSSY